MLFRSSDAGAAIPADAKQAFNYFGARGQLKRWTMMRPIFQAGGPPNALAAINVDFDDTPPSTPVSVSTSSGAKWGSAKWGTAKWAGAATLYKQWQGINGVGYCAAARVKCASLGVPISWMATDIVMEKGGIL